MPEYPVAQATPGTGKPQIPSTISNMLEPPAISEDRILERLREEYGLPADRLEFLPLGVDLNTAVYRVEAGDGPRFLKLRKGPYNEIGVALPRLLSEQGIEAVIPPLLNRAGQLWGSLAEYRLVLYPFIPGQDGYARNLTPAQLRAFGQALRELHAVKLPPMLGELIPGEDYSLRWRMQVRHYQRQVERANFADPLARQLADFLRLHRLAISRLIKQAELIALDLQTHPLPRVLCHGDIHAGNLLLPEADPARLYIVDWDEPVYAPRERDLALIGGSFPWQDADGVALFYEGYYSSGVAQPEINLEAVSYYRCERILTDIALFCQQIFDQAGGAEDREQAYHYLTSAFLPGHEVELALGEE